MTAPDNDKATPPTPPGPVRPDQQDRDLIVARARLAAERAREIETRAAFDEDSQ